MQITTAKIIGYDGTNLIVQPDYGLDYDLIKKQCNAIEIRLDDGRTISAIQRKKIFAIIRDISLWSGHDPEYLRQYLTWDYRSLYDIPAFSLSNVDMTTARMFITYLIEFCFQWSVPTRDTLLNQTDDIYNYLYLCLKYRKCAICNKRAQVHHVDRVGTGRDRRDIVHIGMKAIALCDDHHKAAHIGENALFEKYHICGIALDKYLCEVLHLNTKVRQ